MMGVPIMQSEAAIQLTVVANGTVLAGIIYGTYSHAVGPNDAPYISI
jgi:hypothetical protein